MVQYSQKNFCQFINSLSSQIYSFLSRVFSKRLGYSELGMTDLLIFHITEYCHRNSHNNIQIYKSSAEPMLGNDIDIFIQRSDKLYNWFTFQAKVMSYNGAFSDLKTKSNGSKQQWDKLLDHEKAFGSHAYYLFYVGEPDINKVSKSYYSPDCLGVAYLKELGYSISRADEIKKVRSSKTKSGNTYFKDLFPQNIDPFRKLFCCSKSLPSGKPYKYSDIDLEGFYRRMGPSYDEEIENIPNELPEGGAPIRIVFSLEE